MATFLADYRCTKCGKVSEILLHGEGDVALCPHCQGDMDLEPGGHNTKLSDPEVLKATLKKRSADHTLSELRKQSGWKTGALPPHLRGSKKG